MARLLQLAATSGWLGPSCFSRARSSSSKGAGSSATAGMGSGSGGGGGGAADPRPAALLPPAAPLAGVLLAAFGAALVAGGGGAGMAGAASPPSTASSCSLILGLMSLGMHFLMAGPTRSCTSLVTRIAVLRTSALGLLYALPTKSINSASSKPSPVLEMPNSGTRSCSMPRMPSTGRHAFWFLMGLTKRCVLLRRLASLSPAMNMMLSLAASLSLALLSPSFSISRGKQESHALWILLLPAVAEKPSMRHWKRDRDVRNTLATLSFMPRCTVRTSVRKASRLSCRALSLIMVER
mmetsp:Transcript_39298/g.87445  ORF Transcript_39298/g.87445 Transcript_39298/m.87445 type:complete len:295 (-) Transcript_39298:1536-2420(-)